MWLVPVASTDYSDGSSPKTGQRTSARKRSPSTCRPVGLMTRDYDQVEADVSEHGWRPLTPREEAVLVALITQGDHMDNDATVTDDDRARWLRQVPHTRAGRRCDCGTCPSIELTNPAGATPDMQNSRVVLQASTTGALLLLFIDDDHLSYLELAPLDDGTTFQQFPAAQGLRFGA